MAHHPTDEIASDPEAVEALVSLGASEHIEIECPSCIFPIDRTLAVFLWVTLNGLRKTVINATTASMEQEFPAWMDTYP